jgi:hypothetical protein
MCVTYGIHCCKSYNRVLRSGLPTSFDDDSPNNRTCEPHSHPAAWWVHRPFKCGGLTTPGEGPGPTLRFWPRLHETLVTQACAVQLILAAGKSGLSRMEQKSLYQAGGLATVNMSCDSYLIFLNCLRALYRHRYILCYRTWMIGYWPLQHGNMNLCKDL